MARKTVEQCIESILKDIEFRKSVDYADRAAVRRYNAAADRIEKNAQYINEHYPDQLEIFVQLMYHSDFSVVRHCAPLVLRLKNTTNQQKQEAVKILEEMLNGPVLEDHEKILLSWMLQKWKKEYLASND